MKKNLTVSIGIPAYNEEQNIKRLLKALLKQKQDTFKLEKIIVVSDGSTDQTEARVRSVRDRRIKLIALKQNEGIGQAQNRILDNVSSDILVLFDADVLPANRLFLEEIIKPMQTNKVVGLVGANTVSVPATTWFEAVIAYSHDLKQRVYKRIIDADTIYLCHGRARAFSRSLYKQLRWPSIFAEDAYSYLICKKNGFKFVFSDSAKVVFRSPLNLNDYIKQSRRFRSGKAELGQYFPSLIVKQHFHIPYKVLVVVLVLGFLRHPLLTLNYCLIVAISQAQMRFIKPPNEAEYEMAASSKFVNYPS